MRRPSRSMGRSSNPWGQSSEATRLVSCADRATGRDPSPGGTQRLPAGAGGQAGVRRRQAADLLRPTRSRPARPGLARGERAGARLARWRCRGGGLDPPAPCRARRRPPRPGRPSLIRSRPLDRDLSMGRCRACPHPRRGGRRARRPGGLAIANGAVDGRPGTIARALDGAARGGTGHAADVDPGQRAADPDRLDLGDQRQEHRHPADHAHPHAGRPARRNDDVGRDPGR